MILSLDPRGATARGDGHDGELGVGGLEHVDGAAVLDVVLSVDERGDHRGGALAELDVQLDTLLGEEALLLADVEGRHVDDGDADDVHGLQLALGGGSGLGRLRRACAARGEGEGEDGAQADQHLRWSLHVMCLLVCVGCDCRGENAAIGG